MSRRSGWTWAASTIVTSLLLAACVDTSNSSPDAGRDANLPADYGWERLVLPDGWPTSDFTCATFSTEAQQIPSAMMIVLDRSSSMSTSGKWAAAQQAIVKAIDAKPFDRMALGLSAYPAFGVPGPACLFGLVPTVSCGVSGLAQVPLSDSGTDKSNGSKGPRRAIYQWLAQSGPDTTATDASPGYEALKAAIDALQAHPVKGRRMVLFITDGGFSCASVSKPTRPGYSDGLCLDWEMPSSVITLLNGAYAHTTKPVHTFIVGVPGSDSTGKKQGPYATPPYQMRRALSAYAFAGSPKTVPQSCDGRTFTQTSPAPKVPCHFDMTSGTFSSTALAQIIEDIRGKAVGCTYQLPKVDDKNKVIDKNRVNVKITLDGGPTRLLPRRSKSGDSCSANGCWDYDAGDQVRLLGKACVDVTAASVAKVEISVGCMTILK